MDTVKVLGQAAPSSTSNVDLYTVGSGKSAVISTLAITNTTSTSSLFRVFVRIAGATASASNALVYDSYVNGNDSILMTLGITLSATDVLTVQSGTANAITFHAFGSEIS